ncbi:hypothetical protein TREMEDRAFT_60723 [Tremella mesenterica DSM 1558]|uniref:uncharacterized protein n=1 Tax=Tremella mesenterica (strain ATCC 24925 / CBS 8224 / DSM 1558 / NBRC 9311 / NRRL Y-6157 / RJB 2259-6 / UBC 559-6) TaxID=578456 RepID=UPI0003F4A489|nr:uncharacterized protein TREMEDRAFT_60723 [Tremella mesenterica DSM 1558]EIW71805.1 hypothetical protein TREMEDRAFT_60723 [Tremella mesenterica DSM 1558]
MSRDLHPTINSSEDFRDDFENEGLFGTNESGIPVPVSSVSLGNIHHGGLPSPSTSRIHENDEGVETLPHSLLLDWLKRKETDDPKVGLGKLVVLPSFPELMSRVAAHEKAAKLPTHVSTSSQEFIPYTVRQVHWVQIDAGASGNAIYVGLEILAAVIFFKVLKEIKASNVVDVPKGDWIVEYARANHLLYSMYIILDTGWYLAAGIGLGNLGMR